MNSLVSVILPAYNVEKYMDKCLDSVVKQSYKNIEVIIIDDGSTDNTALICEKYVQYDNRVKYIYQENQGSGPARNKGLNQATGEFVMFVDPDDWIDTDIVFVLYEMAMRTGADLVCCGFTDVVFVNGSEIKRIKRIHKFESLQDEETCRAQYSRLLKEEVLAPPTRKLYKMDIIRNNKIVFPSLRRSQDISFNYSYFAHVNRCEIIDESLYYYRIVEQDAYVAKLKEDYYHTIKLLHSELLEIHYQWGFNNESEQINILNNYFENLLMLAIEANIVNEAMIDPILNDNSLKEIVERSKPDKIFNQVMKIAYMADSTKLLKVLVRIRGLLRIVKRKMGK